MRNDYLKLIIGIITIALVGIVTIQVYWIKNAIELKDQEFQQLVNRVLVDVSYQVEKDEAISFLENHQLGKSLLQSNKGILFNEVNSDSINSPITMDEESSITTGILTDADGDIISNSENNPLINLMNENKMLNRQDIFQQILIDFLHQGAHPNVLERIDLTRLNDLIKDGLKNHHIKAGFTFGIIAPGENLVYRPEWVKQESLLETPYKVKLFANDYINSPNYLSIFFPYQRGYILKSMAGIMSVSIVFILAICWAFWYTIKTIYSQKKVAIIKNDFINNMTHELKTPISTISLACEVLGDKSFPKTDSQSDHYLNMISGENKRLGTLVERVLQSAVLDKGDFKLTKEITNVHQLLEAVVSSSKVKIDSQQGTLTCHFNAKNSNYEVDKVHMSNVFYNLLDNAIKYTKDNPKIIITTTDSTKGLLISVKDNGIGICTDDQHKIFDKLYRVPTGNRHDVKGFGLGLSYVKAIISKHHAEIRVSSKKGEGSTFEILLPRIKKE